MDFSKRKQHKNYRNNNSRLYVCFASVTTFVHFIVYSVLLYFVWRFFLQINFPFTHFLSVLCFSLEERKKSPPVLIKIHRLVSSIYLMLRNVQRFEKCTWHNGKNGTEDGKKQTNCNKMLEREKENFGVYFFHISCVLRWLKICKWGFHLTKKYRLIFSLISQLNVFVAFHSARAPLYQFFLCKHILSSGFILHHCLWRSVYTQRKWYCHNKLEDHIMRLMIIDI